jgi:hypothetical protein
MHKTSTPLHKNTETKQGENISTKTSKAVKNNIDIINNVSSPLSTTLDIEKENRLSNVLSLHIMGLSQEEIAIELKVNQSTVSRDLQYIKQESRRRIDKYMREDVPFEYERYFAAYNEISKKLWQTVNDYNTDPKDKIRALSLLNQANDKRHERLIGGPRDYLKIKQSQSGLILQEYVDNNPELKASIDMRNLFSNSFDGTNKKKKSGVSDLQDLNKSYAFMNKN